jgi:transcriptional regulator with XRE-family HTH domain
VFRSTAAKPGQFSIINDSANTTAQSIPQSINTLVGERVCLRRTRLGLSRQKLSKFLRIDVSELAAHETGAKRMNANLLLRAAEILDVPPDYFFRDKADPANQADVDGDHRRVKAA